MAFLHLNVIGYKFRWRGEVGSLVASYLTERNLRVMHMYECAYSEHFRCNRLPANGSPPPPPPIANFIRARSHPTHVVFISTLDLIR